MSSKLIKSRNIRMSDEYWHATKTASHIQNESPGSWIRGAIKLRLEQENIILLEETNDE